MTNIEVKKIRSFEDEKSRRFLSSQFLNLSTSMSSGFTLIEILISLTILTVVLGAVYGSFFSVQRALERFDNVSLKYNEARTALDIMRREIEGAILKKSSSASTENTQDKTIFVIKDRDVLGKSTSMLDLTAFAFRGGSIFTISYYVEEKDGKLNILKKESPFGVKSEKYVMEILEGVEGFTVETLFNNQWVKTWDTETTGKMPDILRVSVEFDDNGKKVKLIEYAKPRVGIKL
ncbi:MAG: prepilin-type N-terminal cleavage/methylation domain-containing protein [Nitrospirae bacterium]|nr:prepilin-type N-terminal cleavage/methylation domain-containing protein [Nitrospirota bacterium]